METAEKEWQANWPANKKEEAVLGKTLKTWETGRGSRVFVLSVSQREQKEM